MKENRWRTKPGWPRRRMSHSCTPPPERGREVTILSLLLRTAPLYSVIREVVHTYIEGWWLVYCTGIFNHPMTKANRRGPTVNPHLLPSTSAALNTSFAAFFFPARPPSSFTIPMTRHTECDDLPHVHVNSPDNVQYCIAHAASCIRKSRVAKSVYCTRSGASPHGRCNWLGGAHT